jgi:hypothetical protein
MAVFPYGLLVPPTQWTVLDARATKTKIAYHRMRTFIQQDIWWLQVAGASRPGSNSLLGQPYEPNGTSAIMNLPFHG